MGDSFLIYALFNWSQMYLLSLEAKFISDQAPFRRILYIYILLEGILCMPVQNVLYQIYGEILIQ